MAKKAKLRNGKALAIPQLQAYGIQESAGAEEGGYGFLSEGHRHWLFSWCLATA
jgi:hypothetical protein